MLESSNPGISKTFICYANSLCSDYFHQNPRQETPEIKAALIVMKKICDTINFQELPSANELEQFGDSLATRADSSNYRPEVYSLAYISYCATSMGGRMTERILQKAKNVESKILEYFPQAQREQIQWVQSELQKSQNPIVEVPKLIYPDLTEPHIYPVIEEKQHDSRTVELVKIAREALKHGSELLAFAAITAAIQELES